MLNLLGIKLMMVSIFPRNYFDESAVNFKKKEKMLMDLYLENDINGNFHMLVV